MRAKLSEKDNARKGFFEKAELDALLPHLPEPLDDMARFAFATGWRLGELRSLSLDPIAQAGLDAGPSPSLAKHGPVDGLALSVEDVGMCVTGHETDAIFNRYDITDNRDKLGALEAAHRFVADQRSDQPNIAAFTDRSAMPPGTTCFVRGDKVPLAKGPAPPVGRAARFPEGPAGC